jgi:hypothetical protein
MDKDKLLLRSLLKCQDVDLWKECFTIIPSDNLQDFLLLLETLTPSTQDVNVLSETLSICNIPNQILVAVLERLLFGTNEAFHNKTLQFLLIKSAIQEKYILLTDFVQKVDQLERYF